jgi:dTDP-glucose pyrophosphorylase
MYVKTDIDKIIIEPEQSIKESMAVMDAGGLQAILVADRDRRFLGILTDGDLRRHFLKGDGLDTQVKDILKDGYKTADSEKQGEIERLFKDNRINHIPLLNPDKTIRALAIRSDTRSSSNFDEVSVVAMAGGKGTRMAPLSNIIPKPLFPVGHSTMLEKIFDTYLSQGFNSFMVIVNYKKELIRSYFSEVKHDYLIEFLEESEYLGTVGGLVQFRDRFTENFFLTNCDVLTDIDYRDFLEHHLRSKATITILGLQKVSKIPYGVIDIDSTGRVSGITEKPDQVNTIMTGIYLVNVAALDSIPPGKECGMDELIRNVIDMGGLVSCYVIDDGWYDIGQFDEYKKLLSQLDY